MHDPIDLSTLHALLTNVIVLGRSFWESRNEYLRII
jgi:hypothetical protein